MSKSIINRLDQMKLRRGSAKTLVTLARWSMILVGVILFLMTPSVGFVLYPHFSTRLLARSLISYETTPFLPCIAERPHSYTTVLLQRFGGAGRPQGGVTTMVLDNDTRGWIMTCVSGIGMLFNLSYTRVVSLIFGSMCGGIKYYLRRPNHPLLSWKTQLPYPR